MCDDAGNCVGCNTTADCTDPSAPACDVAAHLCVIVDCTDGVKNADETDVDCGGSCGPWDDAKTCVIGADCKSGVCTAGVCQAPECDDGVKNADETDVDCGGDTCPKCGPDKGCDTAEDCVGAECSGSPGTCTPNCADEVKNNAESDVDCGGATCPVCALGEGCAGADANCEVTAFCDGSNQCAAKKAPGVACTGTNECVAGLCDANDGVCCDVDCSGACRSCKLAGKEGTCSTVEFLQDPEDECPGTQACDGVGQCLKVNSDTCSGNGECLSGNCADGLCCNTTCIGSCKACDLAGSEGQCTNIAGGQDPSNECAGALSCNGVGACQIPNGTTCFFNSDCASGFCVEGLCCDTLCDGLCAACDLPGTAGTCSFVPSGQDPDGECAGGKPNCSGMGTCGLPSGAVCGSNTVCASGFCVDGVCCNVACAGTCTACNVAGNIGTCTNVPAGTDPANECAGATPNCNGNGACQ